MLNRPSDYPNVKLPQLQEARNVCIKAVKLSPDDPQPLQTLAAALTLFMDYKAAIEAYESWLVRYGVSHTNQKKQVLKNLGAALIRSGNNERALEVANELMKLDPSPDNIGFVAHVRSIAIPMDTFAGKLKTKGLVREVEEYKLRSSAHLKAVLNSELIKVRQLNPDTAYQSYGRIDDPVFVGTAVVHSNCAVFTGSHHAGIDLQTFSEDDNVPLKTIQHRTASIMGHQLMNYYHWSPFPNSSFSKNIFSLTQTTRTLKSYAIDDTLALPEFNAIRSRFIFYENPTRQRYHFPKGLILADWIHHSNDIHKTLSPHRNPEMETMRVQAVIKSSTLAYLQKRFGSLLKIHTGTEAALVVVGAHGAGLTNYVYTKLGAALVMIPMDPHVEFCFSHMVAALEGRHYIVSDIPGSHYYGSYGALSQAQMVLLGDTVQKALDNVANVSAERDEL
ncbi:hypothetical protein BDR26DRAFT_871906 [Obelidium mucronatum]|nr:hypothetical protein BDR26DRAFT_871906 [Obelidium mucronatum]